jgi:hypothetical protein
MTPAKWRTVMTKGDIAGMYKRLADEDRAEFDKWLRVNAVVATIFAAAFLGMAIVGSGGAGPREAQAETPRATETTIQPGAALSPLELMIQLDADTLPVERVEEPF